MTRRQILERIEAEPPFAAECVTILQGRHERRDATVGEGMGWMASHASKATALATKLASGEATDKERAEAAKLAGRYGKQLARAFRDRDLAARPELGAQAAVFGVGGGGEGQPAPATLAAASDEPVSLAKRRGRPPGSRNKVKAEPKPTRRRRS
jgi:hypothetical protein